MSAREEVLDRVRAALAGAAAPQPVERTYVRARPTTADDLLVLLADRLVDYRAAVHPCRADDTATTVAQVLAVDGARRVGVPPGLDPRWLAAYDGEVVVDDAARPAPTLDDLDGVVTASRVACAETGTIVLDGEPDQGRRALTLVPDLHVCVVDLSAVVATVPEMVAALEPCRPTTLLSGPSATSDIELERVEGVHGPRRLHVVVRTDV